MMLAIGMVTSCTPLVNVFSAAMHFDFPTKGTNVLIIEMDAKTALSVSIIPSNLQTLNTDDFRLL